MTPYAETPELRDVLDRAKIGLLMIPKTCAYIWVIVMGLQLLFAAA